MKNHIPLTSWWACEKNTRMLSYESKFSRHMRNMGNAAEYFMYFKWKSKILVCLFIFYIKKLGVKNKGTILFTNHFDLGWKENSLIKIDWDPVELSMKTVIISTKLRCPPGGYLGWLGKYVIFAIPTSSLSIYVSTLSIL